MIYLDRSIFEYDLSQIINKHPQKKTDVGRDFLERSNLLLTMYPNDRAIPDEEIEQVQVLTH